MRKKESISKISKRNSINPTPKVSTLKGDSTHLFKSYDGKWSKTNITWGVGLAIMIISSIIGQIGSFYGKEIWIPEYMFWGIITLILGNATAQYFNKKLYNQDKLTKDTEEGT